MSGHRSSCKVSVEQVLETVCAWHSLLQWCSALGVGQVCVLGVDVLPRIVLHGFVVATVFEFLCVWRRVVRQWFEQIHWMLAVSQPSLGLVQLLVFNAAWVLIRSQVGIIQMFQVSLSHLNRAN